MADSDIINLLEFPTYTFTFFSTLISFSFPVLFYPVLPITILSCFFPDRVFLTQTQGAAEDLDMCQEPPPAVQKREDMMDEDNDLKWIVQFHDYDFP